MDIAYRNINVILHVIPLHMGFSLKYPQTNIENVQPTNLLMPIDLMK